MNEFVLVEFLFTCGQGEQGMQAIKALGNDFIQIASDLDGFNSDDRGYVTTYRLTKGKISSQTATVIKLSNKFLSDRMRISYISDELKDKYRSR